MDFSAPNSAFSIRDFGLPVLSNQVFLEEREEKPEIRRAAILTEKYQNPSTKSIIPKRG
jgi:hypothetical protein